MTPKLATNRLQLAPTITLVSPLMAIVAILSFDEERYNQQLETRMPLHKPNARLERKHLVA